ncbi:MAG: transposase [Candidatus Heimdallarchaeota archaeon]|nr:transposase [Candidatus Heimdallarchaeota archaeon]MCK5048509.1 transposase [Candidatus Heimdallarchaeota archaeon]
MDWEPTEYMAILCIHPAKLESLLASFKPFLCERFPTQEPSATGRGRPFIGPQWVLVALGVIKSDLPMTWRSFAKALTLCKEILAKFKVINLPSKTTLHRYWKQTLEGPLRRVLTEIAWNVAGEETKDLAIDSSGFQLKAGSLWRLLKWDRGKLKKTSPHFDKAHILADTRSQAVLSIQFTQSYDADVKLVRPLIRRAQIPSGVTCRLHGDKAYHDEVLQEELLNRGLKLIVEPKKNTVDHGTSSFRDQSFRFYQANSGLWHATFRTYRKSSVEHVFGVVKLRPVPMNARRERMQHKQLLARFLMYNMRLWLTPQSDTS